MVGLIGMVSFQLAVMTPVNLTLGPPVVVMFVVRTAVGRIAKRFVEWRLEGTIGGATHDC